MVMSRLSTRAITHLCKIRQYKQAISFLSLNAFSTKVQPLDDIIHQKIEPPSFTGEERLKTYPDHIVRIVEEISKLTLLEVADLSELLQNKLNIKSPAAMMPAMMAPVAGAPATETEEDQPVAVKSSFTVKLVKFDAAKKVPLIKEIKQLVPEMNLVQTKKFVEGAPGSVKTDVSKDEAEEIKAKLEAVGATIEIE